MKLSSQEEYGLRCLLQIAREREGGSLTLPLISALAGVSQPYAAKLMRILRQAGLVKSARGQVGGYALARPPEQIPVGEVLAVLGGRLYEPGFCERHTGGLYVCSNSADCSVRQLWRTVQRVVDQVLSNVTVKDMLRTEKQMTSWVTHISQPGAQPSVSG